MRPIDADELMKIATHPEAHDYVSSWEIVNTPTLDVVPKGVYEQVKWERDIVIEQLEELGLGLGQRLETLDLHPTEAVIVYFNFNDIHLNNLNEFSYCFLTKIF